MKALLLILVFLLMPGCSEEEEPDLVIPEQFSSIDLGIEDIQTMTCAIRGQTERVYLERMEIGKLVHCKLEFHFTPRFPPIPLAPAY